MSWLIPPPQATVKKTLWAGAHLPLDIEQDLKGSMEKTSRNVEVDSDKLAILRGPERTLC